MDPAEHLAELAVRVAGVSRCDECGGHDGGAVSGQADRGCGNLQVVQRETTLPWADCRRCALCRCRSDPETCGGYKQNDNGDSAAHALLRCEIARSISRPRTPAGQQATPCSHSPAAETSADGRCPPPRCRDCPADPRSRRAC